MFVWHQSSLILIWTLTQAETLLPRRCKILNNVCAHGSQSGLRMGKKTDVWQEGREESPWRRDWEQWVVLVRQRQTRKWYLNSSLLLRCTGNINFKGLKDKHLDKFLCPQGLKLDHGKPSAFSSAYRNPIALHIYDPVAWYWSKRLWGFESEPHHKLELIRSKDWGQWIISQFVIGSLKHQRGANIVKAQRHGRKASLFIIFRGGGGWWWRWQNLPPAFWCSQKQTVGVQPIWMWSECPAHTQRAAGGVLSGPRQHYDFLWAMMQHNSEWHDRASALSSLSSEQSRPALMCWWGGYGRERPKRGHRCWIFQGGGARPMLHIMPLTQSVPVLHDVVFIGGLNWIDSKS